LLTIEGIRLQRHYSMWWETITMQNFLLTIMRHQVFPV
ncbi:hypothetical protein T02_4702, partial [Trichinella nativa]